MVVDKAIFTQGILALLVMMSVLITVVATGAYQNARDSRSKNTIIALVLVAKVTVVIWILLSLYKAAQ